MTDLVNQLKFTRIYSDGIYYSDLQTSVRRSVKFDLFDGSTAIATLVTNNKKTFSLTTGGDRFSLTYKWNWINKWWYTLFENIDSPVATIFVHRWLWSWGKEDRYIITFEDTNNSYILTSRRKRDRKYAHSIFQYDLITGNEVKCRIINLKKIKGFDSPIEAAQEGIIEFDDGISIKQILCFLQMMHIRIDLEYSD